MFLDRILSDTFNSSIFKLIIFFVLGISISSKKKLILSSTSGTSVNSISSNFFLVILMHAFFSLILQHHVDLILKLYSADIQPFALFFVIFVVAY